MTDLASTGSKVLAELKSSEHAELLNAIDGLRDVNIDPTEISIPQVVVCGSQSSGKSSVLEAIARVPFPTGAGTKTLFPTELILRNTPTPGATVSIVPAPGRTPEQFRTLQSFKKDAKGLGPAGFIRLHEEAAKTLSQLEPDCGLWSDRLRVEIRGPDQPHLTLVDLPGLIQNADRSKKQKAEDVESIRELAKEYLQGSRTIVLAVINARYDFANQEVMNLVLGIDGAKDRTLGVITNPDGSPSADHTNAVVDLAKGRSTKFGLGWHVVKNLSHEALDRSPETRDNEELKFLSSGPWQKVGRNDVGIVNLRAKLSDSLLDCIRRDLPTLLNEMETKLDGCKRVVDQLGPERLSEAEQRVYLTEIAAKYQDLVRAALNGSYDDPNLSDAFSYVSNGHLRDAINLESDAFAFKLDKEGHMYDLIRPDTLDSLKPDHDESSCTIFHPPYTVNEDEQTPQEISLPLYCRQLAQYMKETRGKNMHGMLSLNTITAVFRQQSYPWERITRAHVSKCFGITRSFVSDVIVHLAGPHTGNTLFENRISADLDSMFEALEDKLTELLWPYQKSHPLTYNTFVHITMGKEGIGQDSDDYGDEENTTLPFTSIMHKHRASIDLIHAAAAVDKAMLYMKVAGLTLVDNVATLAIERQLLDRLAGLLTPTLVAGLSKVQLCELTTEPEEAKQQRDSAKRHAKALELVISVCKRHIGQSGQAKRQQSRPRSAVLFAASTPQKSKNSSLFRESPLTPASRDEVLIPGILDEKKKGNPIQSNKPEDPFQDKRVEFAGVPYDEANESTDLDMAVPLKIKNSFSLTPEEIEKQISFWAASNPFSRFQ